MCTALARAGLYTRSNEEKRSDGFAEKITEEAVDTTAGRNLAFEPDARPDIGSGIG